MKKVTALFLVVLFSFNLFGYLLVVEYLQHRATKELETALDNNLYDDSALVEVKIPVDIPYQANWSFYERYDGEIEINGTPFKFVKRKLSGDTLYLICIPHTKKMHLENVRNSYFALSNDLSPDKARNSASVKILLKNLQTDYEAHSFYPRGSFIVDRDANNWADNQSLRLPSPPTMCAEHPPESIS